MAELSKVGKRGAVVIPAELRRRFGIEEGSLVMAEAHDDGVLLRPATAVPTGEYRRWFLEATNRAYAEMRRDPEAWAQELAERRVLEGSLMDGLEADDEWAAAWSEEAPARGAAGGQ